LNSPSPPLPFILSPPIPRTVSTGIIFSFTCKCTHFLYHIRSATSFPRHLPPPLGANPSTLGRTCPTLLFSDFAKEKREKEKHDIFASL
jgi:hypothetical protein